MYKGTKLKRFIRETVNGRVTNSLNAMGCIFYARKCMKATMIVACDTIS
ncbi:hypothetical protein Rahaq_5050 (plasmid) [Rahnella aceris]|jgi:hypothetical protein|uniref:Uncharacterized protein n=1 Tax=Rahnella sp. (strain Y9602) TaxID=2703885 RepID=A0A0H3FIN6_RAHSY|nr:hypothetical protein Rahaq_5050 [Rahnella aceris]MDP9707515.1 hypothetical protein [Rahnella aquatilis]